MKKSPADLRRIIQPPQAARIDDSDNIDAFQAFVQGALLDEAIGWE